MDRRTILKVGGSTITDKSGECLVNEQALGGIAGVLARHREIPLVLVHGAGSCGHPQAAHYHLTEGITRENLEGIPQVHRVVRGLNGRVVEALRDAGITAIGISPIGSAMMMNGRLVEMETRPIELMLRHGIVPVLHGDVAMDLARGASILSGDQIVRYLASRLRIRRVGLATDVPGVISEGRVLRHLTEPAGAPPGIGVSTHTDVTGGMKGKVRELMELAEQGIQSHVFHISRLQDFLEGSDHGGTVIGRSGKDEEV